MSIDLRQSDIQDGRYLAVGVCHNCKEWQSGSVDFDSTTQPMIYAVGPDDLHLNSDAQDAGLRRHTYWGSFTIDLRAARGDPAAFPPNELNTRNATAKGDEHNDHEYTSSLHAVAMAGTFVLIFPLGTFYKMIMGNVRWHWITQALGLIIVLVGAGLGLGMSRHYNRSKHFDSTHQIIGLVVVILVILQACLGSLHHRIFKAQQRPTIMGMIHRFLGLVVICLGVINGVSGFNLASASHHNTAYAIIIGIVIAILFGLAFFLTRRRRRQEAFNSTPAQNFRNAYNGPENGIPLQPSYGPPPAYGRPMAFHLDFFRQPLLCRQNYYIATYRSLPQQRLCRSVITLFPLRSSTMNGRSGTFSPVSVDGSEWSGISKYQNHPDPSTYPTHPRANLATPPISGSSAGIQQGRFSNGNNRQANAHPGNPSPPNSVARSSVLSDHQRRKTLMMEEALSQHYAILKRYLAQSLRDEKGNAKPNRARDKLLRLSPVQFQELSTDVYDELLRRQSAAGQQTNGPGQVPSFLLPKDNFHPKRNQARQKLATLPPPRFRDLATDVFYELERRFPRFTGADIPRNGSPAPSIRGPPSRGGTPNGVRPGSRNQGPPGSGQGPGQGYGQPRNASLGSQVMAGLGIPGVGGPDDAYGRPTAKTFQSSTIIPNKSTMVEDDDDQTGPSDNDDDRSEFSRKRRDTNTTHRSVGAVHERDRRVMADMERQISHLQAKVENLESTVRERNAQIANVRQARDGRDGRDGKDKAGQEWANLKNSLESKLADAQNLNKNLQTELERVKSNQTATERQLRSELETSKRGDSSENEWKTRYEGLNKAHQDLQAELRQQQMTTREVKQEAAGFLNEMKMLSER
ncbi:MAG: hypothetical protein L6R42_007714, partial [Xanthoria sp. 1 TBL-2021]